MAPRPGSLPETFHEALVVLLGFSLGNQTQNSRRQFLCGVRLAATLREDVSLPCKQCTQKTFPSPAAGHGSHGSGGNGGNGADPASCAGRRGGRRRDPFGANRARR
ncbi:RHA1A [Symbiodinium natans]|uniref:RHA1A protein n=1 Tax=Symbiodinium natans TaxID=878477 RepID=A0A812MWJ7_9DINO|nr:RHA1A [Symbiodinium natans]